MHLQKRAHARTHTHTHTDFCHCFWIPDCWERPGRGQLNQGFRCLSQSLTEVLNREISRVCSAWLWQRLASAGRRNSISLYYEYKKQSTTYFFLLAHYNKIRGHLLLLQHNNHKIGNFLLFTSLNYQLFYFLLSHWLSLPETRASTIWKYLEPNIFHHIPLKCRLSRFPQLISEYTYITCVYQNSVNETKSLTVQ